MIAPVENADYSGAGGMLFLTPHHKIADALLIFSMLLLIVDIYRKRPHAPSSR